MLEKKPIIGVTLDAEEAGGWAKFPWYALRRNYGECIVRYGGVPVFLPYDIALIPEYSQLLDGIVLTGGDFDIPPSYYGDGSQHETVITKPERTDFEAALFQMAMDKKKAVLGICGGHQLMNVLLGGSLIQHIPDSVEGCLKHEQKEIPMTQATHEVKIKHSTLLHHIVKKDNIQVNTSHHQAVKMSASVAVVNAVAPDGVIEGIECADHNFCLGVQWHPEYLVTDADSQIISSFIDAARL